MLQRHPSPGLLIALAALATVLSGFLWIETAAGADIIYFKDGMRTVCQGKAWEEKDEVHCEYDGGLLIYPKNDVLRIEKGPAIQRTAESPKSQDHGLKPPSPPPTVSPSPPSHSMSSASPKPPSGILFYDPRRAKRYWSSATVQHDSYQEALSALASEYDRPAQWIEENMGDSNDLGEIRDTLTALKQAASTVPKVPANHAEAGEIEFYNPRRPQKYWTAPDARHNTYDEALAALAREFGKSPAWVELHMGDSNDIGLIRELLKNAQLAEKGK
jgi:hypothetical protein